LTPKPRSVKIKLLKGHVHSHDTHLDNAIYFIFKALISALELYKIMPDFKFLKLFLPEDQKIVIKKARFSILYGGNVPQLFD
jgi:hypothetical protein